MNKWLDMILKWQECINFIRSCIFLSDVEVKQIKEYVPHALNSVQHLIIAEDNYGIVEVTVNEQNLIDLCPKMH